jgi:hypothetical protein
MGAMIFFMIGPPFGLRTYVLEEALPGADNYRKSFHHNVRSGGDRETGHFPAPGGLG